MNFGVVRRQTSNSPAYGAIFLGLVKERQPRVRPTLLEQTDIKSMRFDFSPNREELTLARRPLLGLDAVPLVDLRELGSPLAQYACRVERLVVNKRQIELQRPCYAIVDTGTTGLVIQLVELKSRHRPRSAPVPPRGETDGSRRCRHDQEEAGPTERSSHYLGCSSQPPPKPSVSPPFDHPGHLRLALRLRRAAAARRRHTRGGGRGAHGAGADHDVRRLAQPAARAWRRLASHLYGGAAALVRCEGAQQRGGAARRRRGRRVRRLRRGGGGDDGYNGGRY